MTDRPVDLLTQMPRLAPLFVKALLPSFDGGPARVPDTTVMVTGLQPDLARLAAYDRVCGFTLRDHVPATWLHVLTFPLHIHLLSRRDAQVRLAGLVHVTNRMRLHRPVVATEVLDVAVRLDNLRPHRRGALLDVIGEVRVADEIVWDGVSTYLAPGASAPGDPEALHHGDFEHGDVQRDDFQRDEFQHGEFEPVRPLATWKLPADLGVQYRRVSGDPNPIHTNPLAARAFGFARPIAHGMWTHARLLAAVGPRLPETYTAQVRFSRPILLPATVGAWWCPDGSGWRGAVTTADGAKPYLLATIRP